MEETILKIEAIKVGDKIGFNSYFNGADSEILAQAILFGIDRAYQGNEAACIELANILPEAMKKYLELKEDGFVVQFDKYSDQELKDLILKQMEKEDYNPNDSLPIMNELARRENERTSEVVKGKDGQSDNAVSD